MAYPSSKQEKDTSTIKKKKRKTKLSIQYAAARLVWADKERQSGFAATP
jgi:hypothetical protein